MTEDSPRGGAATPSSGRFDLAQLAAGFPPAADTLLLDHYMTDAPQGSARLFRVYRPTPPHYHARSNEFLYVFRGRGTFWIGDPGTLAAFAPGQLLVFERGVVHALPELFDAEVVFLAIDSPRREPDDVIFVDPASGDPRGFIARR